MPAKSKSQRRLMGWAYSVKKKGKKSKAYKNAPQSVKDIVNSMTLKDLKKYAKTHHDGLPEDVDKKKNENYIYSFEKYFEQNYEDPDKGFNFDYPGNYKKLNLNKEYADENYTFKLKGIFKNGEKDVILIGELNGKKGSFVFKDEEIDIDFEDIQEDSEVKNFANEVLQQVEKDF